MEEFKERMMRVRASWLPFGVAALLGVFASAAPAAGAQAQGKGARDDHCAMLTAMRVEAGTITRAERFAKGQSMGNGVLATKAAVDICRAELRLQPTKNSDIHVELWLPDTWNGKLFSHGGGGFSGGLGGPTTDSTLNKSAAQGYATATSDLGHPTSASAQWSLGQPEKVIDFAYRANHLVAIASKQVIAAYYKSPAQHAYFQGCSGGGREAMMEVTRYPEDYDGVIAGAPAMSAGEVATQLLWNYQNVTAVPSLPFKLAALHNAVLQACDKLDGVQDGVLENPLKCNFDPAVLQCTVFNTAGCLTKTEVAVARKIYEGPRLAGGEQFIPGLALGSEGAMWGAGFESLGLEYYRWMVYGDAAWTIDDFQLDRDRAYSRSHVEPIVDSANPDIGAFARRGGKLIMYHGWNDTLIPGGDSVRYYEKARSVLGPTLENIARLFMVPGMQHCSGGRGATNFDMVPYLEAWVERSQAPEKVIAVQDSLFSWSPSVSHPLCPWPRAARYNGSGSTKDAASFTCR